MFGWNPGQYYASLWGSIRPYGGGILSGGMPMGGSGEDPASQAPYMGIAFAPTGQNTLPTGGFDFGQFLATLASRST